jgi:ribosomal protein L7Ae-like RNA K-turn-binding protein
MTKDELKTDEQGATQEVVVTEAQQAEVATPEFDASKFNIDDHEAISNLTDEQLRSVEEYNKTASSQEEKPEAETSQSDTDETAAAAQAEKAATDAVKYAGKYATTDDLVKGVNEIAKKLGTDVEAFIDVANETKDYKSVEALYKRLERKLSEGGAKSTGTEKAPEQDTAQSATPVQDPALVQEVTTLTSSQIAMSPLATQFAQKGLQLPNNMQEFAELTEAAPYLAMQFQQLFQMKFADNMKLAHGYQEATKTVETENAKAVDSDTQAIKALATQLKFDVTDEEINAVKAAAMASPYSYTEKYGVKFLRAGAVKDYFMTTQLPNKLTEIQNKATVTGREQAVKDLEAAAKKNPNSIGTAKISTKTRAIPKMPDLSDPDIVASLPDEALENPEKYFKGFAK